MKKIYFLLACLIGIPGGVIMSQHALNIDGLDDYTTTSNAAGLVANSDGISLSVWINPTTDMTSYPSGIAGFRNETNFDFFLLQLNATSMEARFRNSSNANFTITYPDLSTGTWAHYVLVYDGSSLILYHDGIEVDNIPANGTFSNTSDPFYIGKLLFFASSFSYAGDVDEISLWNRALTSEEVFSIYDCGIIGTEDNLQLHYKCDQGIPAGDNTAITTLEANIGDDASIFGMSMMGNTSNFILGDDAPNQTTINPNLMVAEMTLTAEENADSYQWYSCEDGYTVIDGATSQAYTASENGTYAVFMELGDCAGYSTCELLNSTGVSTSDLSNVLIFPNPSTVSEGLTISSSDVWDMVSVKDITGRFITSLNQYSPQVKITTSEWSPGLYFITTYDRSGNTHTQRIILK